MENNSANFKDQLKEKGYKLTTQRQAVLNIMTKHQGQHLSPEEIYMLVREEYPDIGLATIYRTLNLLEDLELITKTDLDDGRGRYEINRNRDDHRHHHLICLKCGLITEVEEDLLDSLEEQILRKNRFQIKDHRVKFYGYCENCSENETKT